MAKRKKIRDLTEQERKVAEPLAREYRAVMDRRERARAQYGEALKSLADAAKVIGEDFDEYGDVVRPQVQALMKAEVVMQHCDQRAVDARNRMGSLAMALSGGEDEAVELDLNELALYGGSKP